jgi:predicted membrane chloride channel (bestrophin family)
MLKNNIIKPLILFLLLSQFVTLAHAIEHQLVIDENEQCWICIHETDSKNTIAAATGANNYPLSIHENISQQHNSSYLNTYSLHSIRSPPKFL